MFRVLIFGTAAFVVFVGIAKVVPLLEGDIGTTAPYVSAVASVELPASNSPESEIHEVQSTDLFETLPSCIISVHPASAFMGHPVSVAWGSANALSAALFDVGAVPVSGGMYITPDASKTYTLTVRSALGDVGSCSTDLKIY